MRNLFRTKTLWGAGLAALLMLAPMLALSDEGTAPVGNLPMEGIF